MECPKEIFAEIYRQSLLLRPICKTTKLKTAFNKYEEALTELKLQLEHNMKTNKCKVSSQELMGRKCIKCGDCCEFIAVGFTLDEVRNNLNFPDRNFILAHWTPRQAPKSKLNPLMSDKCFNGYLWYECDLFDHKTRLCRDYENRANICREYPSKYHKPEGLISCRCGFIPEEKTL